MRMIFLLVVMVMASFRAHAAGDTIPFAGVQEECVQVGEITFGPNGRWANCHVTRGRWFATIDFLDLHQAQYCLGKNTNSCDQKALVIFANRAYTPDAKVLLIRIDEGTMEYDDPLVVISDNENVMSVSSHNAAGVVVKNYYLWRTDHWLPIEAQGWLPGVSAFLPVGTSVRSSPALPDLETMSARVSVFREADADCCPSGGMASVALGLAKEQFMVKQVKAVSVGE